MELACIFHAEALYEDFGGIFVRLMGSVVWCGGIGAFSAALAPLRMQSPLPRLGLRAVLCHRAGQALYEIHPDLN